MVQEFQVLRCFSCHIFQVHQVKKSKVWNCKLCGEKQSLLKVYGQGSGADCRRHVQKLNLLQGEVGQAAGSSTGQSWQHETSDSSNDGDTQQRPEVTQLSQGSATTSRWSKYLQEKNDSTYIEEESLSYMDHSSTQCGVPPTVRKRKKNILHDCDLNDQNIKGMNAKLSKRNTIFENRSVSTAGANEPSCIEAEDMGSSKCHRQTVSHTLPGVVESCSVSKWDKFLPINLAEKERSSSSPSFHKRDPESENKMTPDMMEALSSASVPVDQTIEPKALPKHVVSPPLSETVIHLPDQQTDFTGRAAATSMLSEPFTLFTTDEDFDESY